MKKLSLRIRYTLITSVFLFISCSTLAFISNLSANHMVQSIERYSASELGQCSLKYNETEAFFVEETYSPEPAVIATQASYRLFCKETAMATVFIVLVGSAATYFAAGYVLKPVKSLSQEIKQRNIKNFAEALPVPSSSDEIQELAVSFNHLLAELQHSFQIQKQFSADAAHELRTPLAVLQMKIDVFLLDKNLDEEMQQFVKTLQEQVERLTGLIEDLLWFSRDLPLDTAGPVPLLPLLQDVISELSEISEEKEIEVKLHCPACTVTGQDRLLERVFYNLLENAMKYSPPETVITISVREQENQIIVSIADQGEGIPEKYSEEIFEPFFRIDKSRSRAIGGSGLGLAVCKKILERHHAVISVQPNHPKGSIFQIIFPS